MVLREVTERNPGQQLLQKAYGFHIKKKNEHRVKIKIKSHSGKNEEGWGCSSDVGCLPRVWVAPASIPSTGGKMREITASLKT